MKKLASVQDSYFVLNETIHNNHEDTLKLNVDFFEYLNIGDKSKFKVLLSKENFIKNACNIIRDFNLIKKKYPAREDMQYDLFFYKDLLSPIQNFFGDKNLAEYEVTVRDATSRYLLAFPLSSGFSIRKYIIERHTYIHFEKDKDKIKFFLEYIPFDREVSEELPCIQLEEPLQLIYYGAPGTGKSHAIDGVVTEDNSVRTTFHPDSDYASFVGAYKPTMKDVSMSAFVGKEVHKAQPQGGHPGTEQKIVYKYVPQAFLKAYVQAWMRYNPENDEPYYLVIEEINRGNCAQIFGDLFQLLDRNNMGASSYPITADEDIEQFLATDEKGFAGFSEEQKDVIRNFVLVKDNGKTESIGQSILNGSKLLLPPNLRIWATMNTSDQSLFPIDSAFKRRWNWKYMPIEYNPVGHNGNIISWSFKIGKSQYSWGAFLEKINPEIYTLTESSDKQMGYFFAKADPQTGIISEDVFLNKVLFYLWTDVFKDYDVSSVIFKNKKENRSFRFTDFFEDPDALANFIENLGLKPIGGHDDTNEDASSEESKSSLKFKVGESFPIPQRKLALTALEQYVNNNPDITAEELITEWEPLSNVPHFIESEEEHQKTIATATSFEERTQKVELQNGDIVYVSLHGWIPKTSQELMDAVNAKDWGIDISILSE